MNTQARITTLLALAFAVACTEGPAGPGDGAPVPSLSTGSASQDVEANILVHAADAPPLERLEATFVAVAGERQTFRIRYDVLGEQEHSSRDFFRLDLHEETLLARPDGTPIVDGDSVEITVVVDPVRLLVELGPTGLTFNPDEPAKLRLVYLLANPDFNRDGVVDADDVNVEENLLSIWFRPNTLADWVRLNADRDPLRKRFDVEIDHFSGYTVSW